MKRAITITLTAILALALCACDNGKGVSAPTADEILQSITEPTAASASDLTEEEIQQILAEMEAEEAAQQ